MTVILVTILCILCLFFAMCCLMFVKLAKIEVNVSMRQEFSESDRQLLEDLYNKEGDLKGADETVSFDEVFKEVNDLMLGGDVEDAER